MKTDKLKQLALDIFQGRIFCDLHIRKEDLENLLPIIFMPISFGALDKEYKDNYDGQVAKVLDEMVPDEIDIGMIYADMSSALGRCINGYPIFSSCSVLNKENTNKVYKYLDKLHEMADSI